MSKSIQVYLVVFSTILGFLLVLGCGPSAEKEKMMAFMQDYQKTLDEYADAISKSNNDKKAEIEVKLDALKGQWMLLKQDIGAEVTPQTMEKFEAEFGKLEKKYAELSGKS
jgi:hypothetical protein